MDEFTADERPKVVAVDHEGKPYYERPPAQPTQLIPPAGAAPTPRETSQNVRPPAPDESFRVRRSSGEIDSGWNVVGYNTETRKVIVQKNAGTDVLVKELPEAELRELNPAYQSTDGISSARTFIELFSALDSIGPIEGSDGIIEVSKAKRLINRVRSGDVPLEMITRSNGLRNAVATLLQTDK